MTGEEGEVVRVDLRTLTWETGCASDKQTGGEGLGEAGEFHFRQVKWEVGSECRVEIRWLDRPVQCWGLDQVETMCSLLADQGSLYVFVIYSESPPPVTFLALKGVLGVKNKEWAPPQISSGDRV